MSQCRGGCSRRSRLSAWRWGRGCGGAVVVDEPQFRWPPKVTDTKGRVWTKTGVNRWEWVRDDGDRHVSFTCEWEWLEEFCGPLTLVGQAP